MTIETTSNQARFLGNGATTVFPYTFLIPSAADLFVYYTDANGATSLIPSSAYTVSGIGSDAGGSVTYNPGTPIPAGSILVVQRRLPYTQDTDLVNQDGFYPQVVEDALDSLEMQIQQLVQDQSLNLHVAVTDTSPGDLPAAVLRANKFLAFDGLGNATASTSTTGTPVSAAMIPVVSASTLAIARTALGLTTTASLNIGAGLRNDGAGNIAVNSPITNINSATPIGLAQDLSHYATTGACTLTTVKANTLFNGFCFWVEAAAADATFAIDASDTISGTVGSGVSYTIPKGMSAFIKTDGVSTWYLELFGTPTPQAIASNITIDRTHNNKVLNLSGMITVSFPAPNTLDPDFKVTLINAETWPNNGPQGAAQFIVANGNTYFLYPTQSYEVTSTGAVWSSSPMFGARFKVPTSGGNSAFGQSYGVTIFASPSGSDTTNDGLSAARPVRSITRAFTYINQNFDHNSMYPQISLAAGTYNDSLQIQGPLVGSLLVFINGPSASGAIWKPVGNVGTAYCLLLSDAAIAEIGNVKFDGTGLPANQAVYAVFMHQTSIIDFNAGCEFGSFTGNHISSDHGGGSINFNASYTISNAPSLGAHLFLGPTYVAILSGGTTVTLTGAPPMSTFVQLSGSGAGYYVSPGVTFSGSGANIVQKYTASGLSFIQLNANVLPGVAAGVPAATASPFGSVVSA